jgi:hypothetical protein
MEAIRVLPIRIVIIGEFGADMGTGLIGIGLSIESVD